MGRIEDAIEKARRRPSLDRKPPQPPPRPIARITEAGQSREHAYGGKHIEVDIEALRAHGLLAPNSHERRLADEYRVIKRPLIRNANPASEPLLERGNLLMVCSATSGEGKTFTCMNLCLSMAREKDWSIVLVDGDCAKPHLSRLFSADKEPGLIDLLKDPGRRVEQLIMTTNVPGLSFLPAGGRDEHAAELLASARMASICEELASSDPHRLVIFDSSPLLLTTESEALAHHVGQIVMVVQANKTPQQAVLAALEKVDQTKAVNLILNQAASGVFAGYGGYYGYGTYGDPVPESADAAR